ncbi:hypothetical protein [Pseudophaeobacter sp.]|uniref:hypothetical protein n=1 Tax=Pseudophaeobacter sp. TaxID=1971739 RepID=UPI00262C31E8|nr:hypothetical protein [Pseudophaeobacter sp.]
MAGNKHNVKVGDIFVSSWGYGQTNVDYYEVTNLIGKTMVEVRPISTTRVDGEENGWMSGASVPKAGAFYGEKQRRRVLVDESGPALKVRSYAYAFPWNGKPNNWSRWA